MPKNQYLSYFDCFTGFLLKSSVSGFDFDYNRRIIFVTIIANQTHRRSAYAHARVDMALLSDCLRIDLL
jgi:hypothetical protein